VNVSETLTIHCDKCSSKVGKASRVKIRFAREAGHKGDLDLCRDCASELILEPLDLAAPGLFPAEPVKAVAGSRKA
jgi:hypothetical protein